MGPDEPALDAIADALSEHGYIVLPHALPERLLYALQRRMQQLAPEHWKPARIGRAQSHRLAPVIRSDTIHWIVGEHPAEADLLRSMERLRLGLNRRLFLGLFDYESHFAIYPTGARYQKHLDTLRGHSNRRLSSSLYLNTGWTAADGGELLLYPEHGDTPLQRVLPLLGTLVLFLSEQFPHEVLAAHRRRYSLTGWFRVNSSRSGRADPPR